MTQSNKELAVISLSGMTHQHGLQRKVIQGHSTKFGGPYQAPPVFRFRFSPQRWGAKILEGPQEHTVMATA